MQTISTPELDFFFDGSKHIEAFPFSLDWEHAKDKAFCVLHTSGSTGIPKPVFVTYGTFACNDAHQLIPLLGGKPTLIDYLRGKRYFLALPVFHAACLTFSLAFNVFSGVICVLPPPVPLTAHLANQVFLHGNLDGALLAPSLIVDCYNNDEYCVNMIQRLKFLSYVGGALPEEVGNPLSTRIKLMNLLGSCETALHPLEMDNDPADWLYLSFSPYLGHTFRLEENGLYELVIVRQEEYRPFQGVFSTFPDKQEFATSDLFEPHPTKPGKWVFRARADDIIAFTTAEKLNPITMEGMISANSKVKSALIGGQGQFQASLLIEPRVYPKTALEEEQLLKEIWPSILQANRDCPAHGRIMKGFVMLTSPDKPLPRAGKDTVQRHAALKLYEPEFKALYARMRTGVIAPNNAAKGTSERVNGLSNVAAAVAQQISGEKKPNNAVVDPVDNLDARIERAVEKHLPIVLAKLLQGLLDANQATQRAAQASEIPSHGPENGTITNGSDATDAVNGYRSRDGTTPDLRKVIYDTLAENLIIENITDESDLFQCGLDSLQVPGLLNAINAHLIKHRPGVALVDVKVLYDNPSIGQMIAVLE